MTNDYEFGDRASERQHGVRELQQLRLGYESGALDLLEYFEAAARVRERYRLAEWEVNPGP